MQKTILSPHIDDAILGLGGSIMKWLADGDKVTVINVFSISAPSKIFRGPVSVWGNEREQRVGEEAAVAESVGKIFEYWDFSSSGLRQLGRWRQVIPLRFQVRLAGERLLMQELASKLQYRLGHAETELFIPIAPSDIAHIDHVIVRDAAIMALQELECDKNVWFYEDMPYCARDASIMESADWNEASSSVVIEAPFEERRRLASLYRSQVKERWLSDMKDYHDRIGGERIWKIPKRVKKNWFGHTVCR